MMEEHETVNDDMSAAQRIILADKKEQTALSMALAKARLSYLELTNDAKDGDGYAYLTLSKVIKSTQQALVDNDLAWTQTHDGEKLITQLIHIGGGVKTSIAYCPLGGGREGGLEVLKSQEAKISYLKRSHLKTMLGLAGEEEQSSNEPVVQLGDTFGMGRNVPQRRRGGDTSFGRAALEQHVGQHIADNDQDQADFERVMTVSNASTEIRSDILPVDGSSSNLEGISPAIEAVKPKDKPNPDEMPIKAPMLMVIRSTMEINDITEEQIIEWMGVKTGDLTAKQGDELVKKLAEFTKDSQPLDQDK